MIAQKFCLRAHYFGFICAADTFATELDIIHEQ